MNFSLSSQLQNLRETTESFNVSLLYQIYYVCIHAKTTVSTHFSQFLSAVQMCAFKDFVKMVSIALSDQQANQMFSVWYVANHHQQCKVYMFNGLKHQQLIQSH